MNRKFVKDENLICLKKKTEKPARESYTKEKQYKAFEMSLNDKKQRIMIIVYF